MLRFRSFQSHSPIGIVLVTWLASPIRVSSALASLGSFCSTKSHCLGLSLCDTLGIEPLGDLIPIGEQKNRDSRLGLYHSPIGIRTPTKGTKILCATITPSGSDFLKYLKVPKNLFSSNVFFQKMKNISTQNE